MEKLLILFGILVGIYVLSRLFSSTSRSSTKSNLEKILSSTSTLSREDRDLSKRETIVKEDKKVTKDDVFYLSQFSSLLKRYNITAEGLDAFFEIVSGIIKEGKIYARDELLKSLEGVEEGELKAKVEEFIKLFDSLEKTPPTFDFQEGAIDPNSPKIPISALESWASTFGLDKELKDNPKETFKKILKEKLYQYGINYTLDKIEVIKKNLERNINSDDPEVILKLVEMIRRELQEIS